MIFIEAITAILQYETEQYIKKYNEALAQKKVELEKIDGTYKNGTVKDEKISKINKKYDDIILEAKKHAISRSLPQVEELRRQETERLKKIDDKAIEKLRLLKDVPLSESELIIFAENLGSKDYYVSRLLLNIAEANGIEAKIFSQFIESSYDTKMGILDDLTRQFDAIITQYEGPDRTPAEIKYAYLSAKVLDRAKEMWYGKNGLQTDESLTNKSLAIIRGKYTQVEKGLALSNILKNSRGNARNLLLTKIAEDLSIGESALQISGYFDEVKEFRDGKAKMYRNAERVVKDLEKMQDVSIMNQKITESSDNPFLSGLIAKNEVLNNTDRLLHLE